MTNRMMTRSLIAAVAVTMLPAVAGAQSIPYNTTQVFNIEGTNPLVCNLAIGTPATVDLSIAFRGTTQNIATVGVTCNQASGFTTSYASTNNSVLTNGGSGNANNLAYQAQVTSSDPQFGFALKSLTATASDTVDNYPAIAIGGVSGQFSVVTSTANTTVLAVGTYTDTVSVTLAANP